jgi:hypothetical protein
MTKVKEDKIKELDKWVSEFRSVCRVAFYEDPQQLEKLGITVYSSGRKKKRKEEKDNTGEETREE